MVVSDLNSGQKLNGKKKKKQSIAATESHLSVYSQKPYNVTLNNSGNQAKKEAPKKKAKKKSARGGEKNSSQSQKDANVKVETNNENNY